MLLHDGYNREVDMRLMLILVMFSFTARAETIDNKTLCTKARAVFLRNIQGATADQRREEAKLFEEIRRRDIWAYCESVWYP